MANFDTNKWYQIVLSSSGAQSMDGTPLYDAGQGAAFFRTTNVTIAEEQWQFFPSNGSYVLRTRASGSGGYLTTAYYVNETTAGYTVPQMKNITLADESMFWQIGAWGDGTFYMTNSANGTGWHLNVKSNSLMAMDSNITGVQKGQKFEFNTLSSINNSKYSTIEALATSNPTATATTTGSTAKTTTTSSTSSTSTSTSTSSSTSSSGLSTGAKAGIGAAIGGIALIALLSLAFFLFRRRKRNQDLKNEAIHYSAAQTGETEVGKDYKPQAVVELGEEQRRWELAAQEGLVTKAEREKKVEPVELDGGFEGR